MRTLPRIYITVSAGLFGLYPVYLAISNLHQIEDLSWTSLTVVLYVSVILPSVSAFRTLKMPAALALFNLFVALVIPLVMFPTIPTSLAGGYSTWFVGALSCLIAATAFRLHGIIATLMAITLLVQIIMWGGVGVLANTGAIGTVIYLAAGLLMAAGLRSTGRDSEQHNNETVRIAAETAFKTATRTERQRRVDKALRKAQPLLMQISKSTKPLSAVDRIEARKLEASLRDDIRGQDLISPAVRKAVDAARSRGIDVTLLDEGGLQDLPDDDRKRILRQVASAVNKVETGRITVRAPQGEAWNVTVMATRSGVAKPDIWLKLK
ncbi:hypothetical protein [Rhodoluna sp.]|uniref:hypothetical protein n=1 Tax=Rhodoluna sp. TaxID=1969481 RepID=UPI0025FB7668|nr:hypothetical protein [Rhodoluna sp.]